MKPTKTITLKGIGVSPGIAIGRAAVIKKNKVTLSGILLKNDEEVAEEIVKFDNAVRVSAEEIEAIIANTGLALKGEDIAILETHIELLTDPQIRTDVLKKITDEKKTANDALIEVIDDVVDVFNNMKDDYMRERSADVQDIGTRISGHLNESSQEHKFQFGKNTVIIAGDISPSQTITMDLKHIVGFATRMGGKTSHAAIIAKSRGIPAVVGCGDELDDVENNESIILDGVNGLVIINPGQEAIDEYQIKIENYTTQSRLLGSLKHVAAITTDGVEIKLLANISEAGDLEEVFDHSGEGVGLCRTELLFMGRNSFPDEEEQFEFYKKIALQSRSKPVIIRTIDIGGDKQLSYFGLPAEQNPFLGYRAIRICLDRKDIFIPQLKAILRAGVFGNFKIMFPMISNLQELRAAKEVLGEAKKELTANNISFAEGIETGIMIEIPSAAITADILAAEVDFFSIGTNDLCQYTLAVDRMNEKIAHLYDPFNPGVLRLIDNTIAQARKKNIHVSMCGELASDPTATLLLLGMGLRNFSMSAASIPQIKNIIINNSISKAKEIYKKVMEMDNSQSIVNYLQEVNQ